MNRRGFIGALLGAAVLDPERLLWVPGKKLISVPERRVILDAPILRYAVLHRPAFDLYGQLGDLGIGRAPAARVEKVEFCAYPRDSKRHGDHDMIWSESRIGDLVEFCSSAFTISAPFYCETREESMRL